MAFPLLRLNRVLDFHVPHDRLAHALRLLCSVLAGVLIGLNRTRHGRAAGLRTMTLVSLAACIAMIQVNLLLGVAGKAANSFIVMDLMRLPLGILSGMGFIARARSCRGLNSRETV